MGFDKLQPIGPAATGGYLAAPVFGRVLATWYRNRPLPAPIPPPAEVEQHSIDTETGLLATSGCPEEHVVREWFLAGTAPAGECQKHRGGVAGFFERTIGSWFH